MTFLSLLITFLKYFPEMVELLSVITKKVQEGIEDAQIRSDIKKVSAAFKNPNRQQAAQELNDLFRKP